MHPVAHPLFSLGIIIVAAGRGERLRAAKPKAFIEIAGASLLQHCATTVNTLKVSGQPAHGQLVLVVPEGQAPAAFDVAESLNRDRWQVTVVTGGRDRHESVRKGLGALGPSIDTVLVHDAARPLTPADVFERVVTAVHETGVGAVPGIRIVDSLKRVDADGTVIRSEDRDSLIRAQTPQGFSRRVLEEAHHSAALLASHPEVLTATDDAAVVQHFGGRVRWVEGSPLAHKVTEPDDVLLLAAMRTVSEQSS